MDPLNQEDRPDYYQILGLQPDCSSQDIKKQYHKLALKWHPDKAQDDTLAKDNFSEIQEAYSVLSNQTKRKFYDNYGRDGVEFNDTMERTGQNPEENIYFKKGFHGTKKNAFEILKGIFKESDEDNEFFDYFDHISNSFRDKFKSFVDDNVVSTDTESEIEKDFCTSYKPTFLDNQFLFDTTYLQNEFDTKNQNKHSQAYVTINHGDGQKYTKMIDTRVRDGMMKQTNKEMIREREKRYFEQENYGPALNSKEKNLWNSRIAPILIDDDEEEDDKMFTVPFLAESYKLLKNSKNITKYKDDHHERKFEKKVKIIK